MNSQLQKQHAWALYREGKLEDARQICEELCHLDSVDAETLYLLGSCRGKLGQYTDAVTVLQESLVMQPGAMQSLFALGGALLKLGRLEEAADRFREVLRIKPKMFNAHCALADTLATLGLTVDAQEHYETARDLRPDRGEPYIGLGHIIAGREGGHQNAVSLFRRALECEPENPSFQCCLGMALTEARPNEDVSVCYEEAHACYQEALRIAPGYPQALAGIARLFNLEGKYEQALELIESLRGRGIYNATAAIAFTGVCKYSDTCDDAVEYANAVLEKGGLPRRLIAALNMHLARLLDQMNRYDEAWPHFVTGNNAAAQLYDSAGFRLQVEKTISAFTPASLFSLPRSDIESEQPVFIVGMPRSGTSLVEQILAAHPRVTGGGELTFISDIVTGMASGIGSVKPWQDALYELKKEDLNAIAHRYLQRLGMISGDADRVTDKMPHNFLALGLIQLVFPKSRIIHCVRDARDTSLSIFFQNFLDGHEYSRHLYHIGSHYHQYQRLMEHWRRYLSIPILDVQYEDLVSNPEPVVRRMLEHCGLEWYEGCLDYHKARRVVNTASYDQVRQPLYSRSVGRWRHYEQHLDELMQGLEHGF